METTTPETSASQPVSPLFQITLMVITTTIISIIYAHRLTQFKAVDIARIPKPITPELRSAFPKKIHVGFYIESYESFNIIKNEFVCNAHVWFTCDPGTISLTTLDKFTFERGKILYRSSPYVAIVNNQLMVSYEIRLMFSTSLIYSLFPFDEHRITINLTNKSLAPQEAIFEVDNRNFIVAALVDVFGWFKVDSFATSGYETVELDPFDEQKSLAYICATFYIDYSHYSVRLIMSIILPILLIFYLSLLSLSMRGPYQSTAAVAALTGIITYRFVIDNLSPQVGYFMISDYLFITFLIGAFCSLVVAFLDTFGANVTVNTKKIIISTLHITIICINLYLTT